MLYNAVTCAKVITVQLDLFQSQVMQQAFELNLRSLILVDKEQSAQTNVFFCDVIQPILPIFFLGRQLTQLPLESPYFLMLPVVGAFALNLG